MTGHNTPSSKVVIHYIYMLFYTKKGRSYTLLACLLACLSVANLGILVNPLRFS